MIHTVAVLSDIHSNLFALDAVLEDIAGQSAGLVVNLGDSLFGPIDPAGTAERLMRQENMVHLMGNCDEMLLEENSESATFRFVKPLLAESALDWIRGLPRTRASGELLFCHGTPASNSQYLLEEATPEGVRLKTRDLLQRELQGIPQRVVFCGHSHAERAVYLPDGKMIVNAGSVGLPAYEDDLPYPHVMASGTPHAKYALARRTDGGSWSVAFRYIPYDWQRAAKIAREHGRPDYAEAIATGTVTPSFRRS